MLQVNIGEKYKGLKVVSQPFIKRSKSNESRRWVTVECSCEKQFDILIHFLFNKSKYTQCKHCSNKINANKQRVYKYELVGDFDSSHFRRIKRNASNRNIEFNISMEYAWNLFKKQNERCALSGLPIRLKGDIKKCKYTASLDRIDSQKGYIENNLQWVHVWVNKMKSYLPNEDFIYICNKITIFNYDNFEPSLEDREIKHSRKVQRLTVEDSLSNNTDTSIH